MLWQVLWHERFGEVEWLSLESVTWLCISCDWGLAAFVKSVFTHPARQALKHLFMVTAALSVLQFLPTIIKKDYFHGDELVLGYWAFYISIYDQMWSYIHVKRWKFFTNVTERRVNRNENGYRKSTIWDFKTGQHNRGRGASGKQTANYQAKVTEWHQRITSGLEIYLQAASVL